jgi:hypothetical protein
MNKALFMMIVLAALTVSAKAQSQKMDRYDALVGKDLANAMKVLNIKDTTGKTSYAFAPQLEKGTKFLMVKLDNGDQLAFDAKKKFRAVFPAQKKPW